jgi:putative ABC transport system permease protein
VETPASVAASNPLNPETIALALETLAMLLIGLVAVGGFTVLAQRRLRSIGMVGALGATDRHIRLVVRANGVVVGAVGAVLGAVLGLLAWLAYRPTAETDAHHLMGAFQLPWIPIVAGMVLAVLATYFAASRPGRAITRVPIVTALSGRPAPPKRVHRSAVPGVVFLLVAFFLMSYSGASSSAKPKTPELVLGLAALIPALILLSPFCLATVARLARRAPIAVRLALRDLSRYRARSGSALAAISLGILIAVIVAVVAAARYGNVLDYAGPNLASNQLIVYTPNNNPNCGGPSCGGLTSAATGAKLQAKAKEIANGLGASKVIVLDQTNAGLSHAGPGRNFSGPLYVATPQLLGAFGIEPSSINPKAEILSMRPGFGGISNMQFSYGNGKGSQVSVSQGQGPPGGPGPNSTGAACGPKGGCLPNPVIQQVNALPSGTSAPNTVITEHAVHQFHLQVSTAGWLIQAPQAPTASQITNAQQAAASLGMYVETKNSSPSPSEIINSATLVGILLALGILAMSVGLIRSETAAELRTLAATGASSSTRRTLTATTAGALGLIGAVLGTLAGYVAVIGYIRGNSLNGGISALGSVPLKSLLIILVGMPVVAAIGGWLLSGREQSAMARQPLE